MPSHSYSPPPGDGSKLDEPKTDWKSLRITSLLTFLYGIQLSIFFSALWPYLLQLNPSTTQTFFGFTNTMYSLGQGIMCPVFGYFANKMGQNKIPILFGVFVMVLGHIVYLMCPLTPFPPQYVMLVSRIVSGAGAGVTTVLRSYCATASTTKDRSRAISMSLGSLSVGIGVGPALQALFTSLGYPGIQIFGNLYLNMYTASAFCCLVCNVISIILLLVFFEESTVGLQGKPVNESGNDNENEDLALPSYDKLAVAICVFTQFVLMFVMTNIETVDTPFAMIMFNWSKKETVFYSSLKHIASSGLSLTIYGLDLTFDIGNKTSHRIGVVIGMCRLLMFHLLTFSWWNLPGKIAYQEKYIFINGSQILNPNPVGCSTSFEWCKYIPPVNMWISMNAFVMFVGVGYSIVNICMMTVFTRVLGPRKQGTMTGVVLLAGCIARTVGPVLVSTLFQHYGPRPVWTIEIAFTGGCALLWLVFYNRLVPLKAKEQYAMGEKVKTKDGYVYNF